MCKLIEVFAGAAQLIGDAGASIMIIIRVTRAWPTIQYGNMGQKARVSRINNECSIIRNAMAYNTKQRPALLNVTD